MNKKMCYQCKKLKDEESSYLIDNKYFCEECFSKIITGREQIRDIEPLPDT